MPNAAVKLAPGVNVEKTQSLNEYGISVSSNIRFRDGMWQKIGGWVNFLPSGFPGVTRDLHAWEDLNTNNHLAIASTQGLFIATSGSTQAITPQTLVSNFAPNFSTIIGTPDVEIIDSNILNVTALDAVFFNTPVSVGGIVLSGTYQIDTITGPTSYKIVAATNATSTVTNGGAVPVFTTTINLNQVNVQLNAHGMTTSNRIRFNIPTTFSGVTIVGDYPISGIVDVNNFTINAAQIATANNTVSMNGGLAQIVYYINLGPPGTGVGFGLGPYGGGGFGTGIVPPSQVGTPITAIDWSTDNWGEDLIACPKNGGIYYWDPTGGFTTAVLISTAPIFNTGAFVSTTLQTIVAYGSTPISSGIGVIQDPMFVRWCDLSNFFEWSPTTETQAGGYRIPIGSRIVGGLASGKRNLLFTDLGCWAMNYVGPTSVFGFNQIANNCGLIARGAVAEFRGVVYWMGPSNFYQFDGSSVTVIPCSVWDAVFQNINSNFAQNCRIGPNSPFDEIWWHYPNASSTGENNSIVKYNVISQVWDYTPNTYSTPVRSAWIDQSVLGPPIAALPQGLIYQHEVGFNASDGQPISWQIETGYFAISEGHEMAFVDWCMPDFKFGFFGGSQNAQIQVTLKAVDYPGDTAQRTYGPFVVTKNTQWFNPRLRGRLMAFNMSGNDVASFVRMGDFRFRYSPDGRRP